MSIHPGFRPSDRPPPTERMRSPKAVHMSRSTLRFDDDRIERAFWYDFARRRLPLLRVMVVALVVIVSAFSLVDRVAFPHHLAAFTVVRYAVLVPLLLLALVALYQKQLLARVLANVQGFLLYLTLIVGGFVTWVGWMLAPDSGADGVFVSAVCVYFCFFCYFGMSGIRFTSGLWVGVAALLIWIVVVGMRAQPEPLIFGVILVFGVASAVLGLAISYALEFYSRREFARAQAIRVERERAEELILNVLPEEIAQKLKFRPGTMAERFAAVSVLFADIVGFTPLAERLDPDELLSLLDEVFSDFDDLVVNRDLEKIKTIGDAYMVAAGVPRPREDHATAIADLAIAMQAAVARIGRQRDQDLSIRIGIHSGPAVAGVIGLKKFAYDLWGDTVNTAARLESHGAAGRIQISEATRELLGDGYRVEARGPIDLRGKGLHSTFWLEGPS